MGEIMDAFDDYMKREHNKTRKQVNRNPPMTLQFSAIDDSMLFLDLCYLEVEDEELRECEARYHSTFNALADGNNKQEDIRWKRY